jgi:hypothetical protein
MERQPLLDPNGWAFYCEHCDDKTEARLVESRDPITREEYFELVSLRSASTQPNG